MPRNHQPNIFGKIQSQNRLGNRTPPPSKAFPKTIPELEVEHQIESEIEDLLGLETEEEDKEGNPFLRGEIAFYPSSTNIFWIKFFPSTGEIMIQYRRQSGNPYLYESNLGEAKAFLQAQSKGKYAIAVYRPRGYRRVPSSYNPKWQT